MDMIDRVAAAIMLAVTDGHGFQANWKEQPDDVRGFWRTVARAAIEAMREPTDCMCRAGAAKWDDDWCSETNALNMWSGMIDAALSDKNPQADIAESIASIDNPH
ncbi:hypothetical protein JQ628_11245 [Bradyrhizobium lablabi]|uniref:hypothetical protein n=1 Tax=Bradyrhizobium lablabi TaxID=722472 RepID=UPI001BA94E7A|nr:hypothetical protein [Bradyrhizobium lablabi]MBR1122091.1 hypothetical protein [Bradyrhizobium lablabi]